MKEPRFQLGLIIATPGALEEVHPEDRIACLAMHAAGDWGILDEDDRSVTTFLLPSEY